MSVAQLPIHSNDILYSKRYLHHETVPIDENDCKHIYAYVHIKFDLIL